MFTNKVKFEDTMGKKHKINFRRAVKKVIVRNYKKKKLRVRKPMTLAQSLAMMKKSSMCKQ